LDTPLYVMYGSTVRAFLEQWVLTFY